MATKENDEIEWIEVNSTAGPSGKNQSGKKKKRKKRRSGGEDDDSSPNATAGASGVQIRNAPLMPAKSKKKGFPKKGEQRAEEIRRRKREQFLKMLFSARTTSTPWIDVQDIQEVHKALYGALKYEKKDIGESPFGKRVIIIGNTQEQAETSIGSLSFARNKLSAWKTRCRNIQRSQIIVSHLTSLESILNVLIEEFNFCESSSIARQGLQNSSVLYSLYSMAVINFCNALTSYSSEYNIDITVRNVAELFECPNWIVNCRHSLSHPTSNPPTLGLLAEAIGFALEWLDRFFWSKAMCGQFDYSQMDESDPSSCQQPQGTLGRQPSSPKPVRPGLVISNADSTLNFGPPVPRMSKEKVHHETCQLLFTSCTNNRAAIKRNIGQYMLFNPNEYIRSFVEILVFGVPTHESLSLDSYSLPPLLLRRSSRIFTLVFSSLPADQMLILLLNILIELIDTTSTMVEQQKAEDSPHLEYHQRAHHSGHCWLWAIVDALTVGIDEDDEGKPQRRTVFQRSFDFFGDLTVTKLRHTYVWLRMLYRLCHLKLNSNTAILVRQFYHLVDHQILSPAKLTLILDMINLATSDTKGDKVSMAKVKSLADLKSTLYGVEQVPAEIPSFFQTRWNIPIGASLNSLAPQVEAMDVELSDKYKLSPANDENVAVTTTEEQNDSLEMIVID